MFLDSELNLESKLFLEIGFGDNPRPPCRL